MLQLVSRVFVLVRPFLRNWPGNLAPDWSPEERSTILVWSDVNLVKKLFKSNQTRYVSTPVHTECKTKGIFAVACLAKKLVFPTEICVFLEKRILKIGLFFHRVKELFKSDQTGYGVSHVYLERKTERIFGVACLEKSSCFNRNFRLIRLF